MPELTARTGCASIESYEWMLSSCCELLIVGKSYAYCALCLGIDSVHELLLSTKKHNVEARMYDQQPKLVYVPAHLIIVLRLPTRASVFVRGRSIFRCI